MARIGDDLHASGPAQGTEPKILTPDHGKVGVPSDAFVAHGDLIRDGQDLILKADGQSLVIKGYFSADPHPAIHSPSGAVLTPDLVHSFAHREGPVQYADNAQANDASPVGVVKEVHGHATIRHTDGTTETIIVGTAVHEGDVIETDGQGAVNILFRDNSSFAVSHNAKLAIDEYVFDPHSDAGASNFSMLRGMFVYTSGLIGHQDPDDVHIHTPAGSIGIRGTVIVGDVDTGQVTVVEGAIVLTSNTGEEMTLSSQYETAQFDTSTGHITNEGIASASDLSTDYSSLSGVAPAFFSGLEGTGTTAPGSTTPDGNNTTAPDSTTPSTAPTDGDHTETIAPSDTTTATAAATDTATDTASTDLGTATFDTTGTTAGDTFGDTDVFSTGGSDTFIDTSTNSTLTGGDTGPTGTTTITSSGSTTGSATSDTTTSTSSSTTAPAGSTFTDNLPVAAADTITPSTNQNTAVAMGTFTVLANDTDADPLDTLSVIAGSFAGDNGGTFTLDAAGHVGFNPGTAFISLGVGASMTTSYNYTVMDSQGGQSLGNVSITVTGLNDAPNAVADTVATNAALGTTENANIVSGVNVLSNDSDPDSGDTFNISAVAGSGTNIGVGVAGSNGGTFVIDASGNLTFNPGTAFDSLAQGATLTTSVTYTIIDGNGQTSNATATVRVTGTNDAPILAVSTLGIAQGQSIVLDTTMLNVNDADATAAMLVFTITSLPTHGTIDLLGAQLAVNGTFTLQDIIDGNVKYNNDGNPFATDSIGYSVSDGAGGGFSNTLSITIAGVVPLDLTTISGGQGFTITDNIDQVFGSSISGGQDLDGDGLDDLLFVKGNNTGTGLYFQLNGQSSAYGNLTVGGGPLVGQGAGFTTGSSVSQMTIASIGNFGTVSGEMFIVGAPLHDGPGLNSGQALILDSAGTIVYTLEGFSTPLKFGSSVASVGDVNGDGYDDVLIGAPLGASPPANSGSIYLIYGGQAAGTIDLSVVSPSEGVRIDGTTSNWKLGTNVSGAGDFNDDGFADFMTSVPGAGQVNIYLGGTAPNLTPITINTGGAAGDIPVMNLGDVNGDGISDVGVISHTANGGSGELAVYFGGSSHTAGQSLTLAASNFSVNGSAGTFVTYAGNVGDFNGDGINDIGVVTRNSANTQADIYIVFGSSTLSGAVGVGTLTNVNTAFHTTYNLSNVITGGSDKITIGSAGDLNGDGFGDAVIGIPGYDGDGDTFADGQAIVVYGTQAGLSPVVVDGGPGDGSPTPNIVTATGNNQSLVSGSSNDTLNDNTFTNISFSAGGGSDAININNGSFHTIDGGAGTDTLSFQGTGSLDFTGLNAESIKRIEAIDLQAGSQSLILDMNNIFNLMETSDTASLTITSSGSLTNTLSINNLTGTSGNPSGAGADAALSGLLGADSVSNSTSTYDFHFGNHTLSIEHNLVDGGHVTVV